MFTEGYGVLSFVGSLLGSNGFCLRVCNKLVFGSLLCGNGVLAVFPLLDVEGTLCFYRRYFGGQRKW